MKALLFVLGLLTFPALGWAEHVLFDLSQAAVRSSIVANDAVVTGYDHAGGYDLEVTLGTERKWPSIHLPSPDGLDLSTFASLVLPVKNLGDEVLTLSLRVDSEAEGHEKTTTTRVVLKPGGEDAFRLQLFPVLMHPEYSADDFFAMRGIPFFRKDALHLEKITRMVVFGSNLEAPRSVALGKVRAEGVQSQPQHLPENLFPIIDPLGQFKHKDWPGKTHSLEQLRKRQQGEAAWLEKHSPPKSWDRFGGFKEGPKLDATGWFRTEKIDGKWHLVDPDGHLFFSHGVDCVRWGGTTVLDDRRHWFEKLPEDNEEHAPFYSTTTSRKNEYYYFNRKVRAFSSHHYNLKLKYGEDWQQLYPETTLKRLPIWGINTLGNWSEWIFCSQQKMPYTTSLSGKAPPIEGSEGYWRQFPDVFHPDFKKSLHRAFNWESLRVAKEDPWCIGLFVDNELSWGDEVSLAVATIKSPATQKAKQIFVEDLKARYGEVTKLNAVWATTHASWDELLHSRELPDVEKARADLEGFYKKIADTYFRSIREVLKEHAPNHLYLGCRFAWSNPIAAKSAATYCDVVSFNAYTRNLATKLPTIEEAGDVPCIIGEFHFGALDRGLFHTGLVSVQDQEERAQAYREYVSAAIAHPTLVGCHWFQYMDSPTTGRSLDGENYQIGFTDVCDTPYPELIKASRAMGERLYSQPAVK